MNAVKWQIWYTFLFVVGIASSAYVACDIYGEPLHPLPPEAMREGIHIDANGQPQWALDVTQDAIDVWQEHAVQFQLADDGNILIYTDAPAFNGLGLWILLEDGRSMAYVSDSTEYNASCAVARELGYSLSLNNVEGKSLMGYLTTPADAECYWSFEDRRELCQETGICQ